MNIVFRVRIGRHTQSSVSVAHYTSEFYNLCASRPFSPQFGMKWNVAHPRALLMFSVEHSFCMVRHIGRVGLLDLFESMSICASDQPLHRC